MKFTGQGFDECERALLGAVSRKVVHGSHGEILTIDYNVKPIYGEVARVLYEFALCCGFKPKFGQKAKFNQSQRYSFVIEDDEDGLIIAPVRRSPMTYKEVERWCRYGNQKKRR